VVRPLAGPHRGKNLDAHVRAVLGAAAGAALAETDAVLEPPRLDQRPETLEDRRRIEPRRAPPALDG